MTMDEILESVIELAENDQSIDDGSVIRWVNQAINRINTAVECNIPLVSDIGAVVPAFDERYHESLVLFCVSKYRAADSSYGDADYFMAQFNDMVKDMQRDMVIQPSIRKGDGYQQIIVPIETPYTYTLDIPYGSYFSKLEVFHNDKLLDGSQYRVNLTSKLLILTGISLVYNDKITVHYESGADLNNPPHQWWGHMGW